MTDNGTHLITRSERTRVRRLIWVGCVLAVIIGSLLPANSVPTRAIERLHLNDKVQHVLAYAVLALLPVLHEQHRNMVALLLITPAYCSNLGNCIHQAGHSTLMICLGESENRNQLPPGGISVSEEVSRSLLLSSAPGGCCRRFREILRGSPNHDPRHWRAVQVMMPPCRVSLWP